VRTSVFPHREESPAGSGAADGVPERGVSAVPTTGDTLGTFDSEAEVAAALVFAKLDFDQVEVLSDASPVARYAARA